MPSGVEDGADDEERRLLSVSGVTRMQRLHSPGRPPLSAASLPLRRLLRVLLTLCLLSAALLLVSWSTWRSAVHLLPMSSIAASHLTWLPTLSFPPFLSPSSAPSLASSGFSALFPVPEGRALLLVVHSTHDAGYASNLAYFIAKAVRCWQDADYVIVIQRQDADSFRQPGDERWKEGLPPLPSNARYVLHQNQCMDLGTVGWLLRLPATHPDYVDTARYRYFVLINTSVRGPLLPAFLEDRMDPFEEVQCIGEGSLLSPSSSSAAAAERDRLRLFSWFHVFLGRIDEHIRLVGCTASCSFATHVQSYVLAMDYVALQLMWTSTGLQLDEIHHPAERQWFVNHWESRRKEGWEPPTVSQATVEFDFERWTGGGGISALPNTTQTFSCGGAFWDTVFNGEIGATNSVLRAGYNVAVLEPYWRGVDFRMQPDICARMVGLLPIEQTNHYENGVPATRLRPWNGQLHFNDPVSVVFTKSKANKPLGSDSRLQLLLSWEELYHRTLQWQRSHNLSSSDSQRG